MTAPIYMAAPPELHSTLLSSSPGPSSLLEAAGAWNSLSAEYTSVAEELSSVLAEVQTGAWQGPSAESFVSAYVPYLAWLTKASADSAAAATQHETAAAAYTAALAAMPTMPELATNHVVHGVLQATNFFGINTIPIAVNEADYVRMWVQAATTMSAYQMVADTAVASTPATDAAPVILKTNGARAADSGDPYSGLSGDNPLGLPQWLRDFLDKLGIGNSPVAHAPTLDYPFDDALANFLKDFGINWDPAAGTVNGASYDSYANPGVAIYYVARALELFEDFQQFGTDLVQNPVAAFQYLFSWELFDFPLHIEEVAIFLSQSPALFVAAGGAALAPLGAGAAGLAGLGALAQPPTVLPVDPASAPALFPVSAPAPAVMASSVTPTAPPPSPTPASPASAPAAPPPPAPSPPPAAGPGFSPPYIVGGPTAESWMSTKAKTQEPTSRGASKAPEAAAAAVAAAAEKPQRRRRRATQHDHADEFADMNVGVSPVWSVSTEASGHGAGPLGFSGTVTKSGEQATGLATLTDDGFGSGPTMPMLPNTWSPEGSPDEGSGS
ncbi:PPE family protein [Mycobacterium sp.]|uniref:PPE family protein n=1 Tax=Mycobacterium sp. TaxID=1785 RepID=UPI003D11895B